MRVEQLDGPDEPDRKCTRSPEHCPRRVCSDACVFVDQALAFISVRVRVLGERLSNDVELWLRRHSELDADVVTKVKDIENANQVLAEAAGRVEGDLATAAGRVEGELVALERPDDEGRDPSAAA